jgi:hypothetical protein
MGVLELGTYVGRPRKWPRQYPYDPRYWKGDDLGRAYVWFILRMYFPERGSASTAGGRSHTPLMSKAAQRARRKLAWRAWHMRVVEGASIRAIADDLGVAKSAVGRWLKGVPRVKQDQLPASMIN